MNTITTCQICAKPVRLTATGRTYKHGYTRIRLDYCPGSGRPPYEQSRICIGFHIENCKKILSNRKIDYIARTLNQLQQRYDAWVDPRKGAV